MRRIVKSIAAITVSLASSVSAECIGDVNDDRAVSLGELQMCVNSFLGSCSTSTPTATPTATPTPGIDDCCDAGFLCGPPSGGGCPIGVPVFNASCDGGMGKCVTFTPTPTSTEAPTPGRFVDNQDGTVTDNQTGLTWEKKTNGGIHDVNATYSWSTGSPYAQNGTVLTTLLSVLNGGTSVDGSATDGCFAGHCDWRLPTIEELRGILLGQYPCAVTPCIDPVFGPTQGGGYWSVTTVAGLPASAWDVGIVNGQVTNGPKTGPGYVLAVRGGH